jgi:hypothetical protein
MTKASALAMTLFLGVAAVHAAADWPQWQGPDRTRISKETGLLKEWPSGGPRVDALLVGYYEGKDLRFSATGTGWRHADRLSVPFWRRASFRTS